MKLYIASSWRNEFYPEVVRTLREAGHEGLFLHLCAKVVFYLNTTKKITNNL